MSNNVEFAVQLNDTNTADQLKSFLSVVGGVEKVQIFPTTGTLIVKSDLPISLLQEKIESFGKLAVVKGYGSIQAAVAILGGECGYGLGRVQGVVRFIQVDHQNCVVDGTIDGLTPGLHGLHVHEFGDISDGCNNIGEHFSIVSTSHGAPVQDRTSRHTGDLGNIYADENGRAYFRFIDKELKVWDIIGRSVAVAEKEDDLGRGMSEQSHIDGNSGKKLGCGIIARSAGLFENSKKICACDGVSLWDEREKPSIGNILKTNL